MKARKVYERALALINERDSGGAYHSDVTDFEKNAPELISGICTLLMYDQCIIEGISVRHIDWSVLPIDSLDSEVPLHEALAEGVMPYALASFLILEEDQKRAEYFRRLYVNARNETVSAFANAKHTRIRDVY